MPRQAASAGRTTTGRRRRYSPVYPRRKLPMLINCVAYEKGSKLADISVKEISDYLLRPDCFVWVAIKDATDAELTVMQDEFGLHELAIEDARHGHQRPKVEEYGE